METEEKKTIVLASYGIMPEKDENEPIYKLGEVCEDGDRFRVESMIALEGEYGIYFLMCGFINQSIKPVKVTSSATLSKTIAGVINSTREFKVPFTIDVKKGINPAGQPYTAGKVTL